MREWRRHPRVCGVPGPKCTGTSSELGPVPGPRLTGLTSALRGHQAPSQMPDGQGPLRPRGGPRREPAGLKLLLVTAPLGDVSVLIWQSHPQRRSTAQGSFQVRPGPAAVRLRGQRSWGLSPSPVTPPPLAGTPVLPGAGVGTRTWSEGDAAPAASVWAGSVCGGARARARPLPWCPSPGRRGRHRRRLSGALPVPAHFTSQRPASPPLPGGAQAERAGSWVADGPGSGGPNPGCQQRL